MDTVAGLLLFVCGISAGYGQYQPDNLGYSSPQTYPPVSPPQGYRDPPSYPPPASPPQSYQAPPAHPQPASPPQGYQSPPSHPQPASPPQGYQAPPSHPQPASPPQGYQAPPSYPPPASPPQSYQGPPSHPQPSAPHSYQQQQSNPHSFAPASPHAARSHDSTSYGPNSYQQTTSVLHNGHHGHGHVTQSTHAHARPHAHGGSHAGSHSVHGSNNHGSGYGHSRGDVTFQVTYPDHDSHHNTHSHHTPIKQVSVQLPQHEVHSQHISTRHIRPTHGPYRGSNVQLTAKGVSHHDIHHAYNNPHELAHKYPGSKVVVDVDYVDHIDDPYHSIGHGHRRTRVVQSRPRIRHHRKFFKKQPSRKPAVRFTGSHSLHDNNHVDHHNDDDPNFDYLDDLIKEHNQIHDYQYDSSFDTPVYEKK